MDSRYIRNYLVVVAGMFCWLNASVVSAQAATNLKCNWCVGPGEISWNAVEWGALDPPLRQRLRAQQDQLDALQARVDASDATVLDLSDPPVIITEPGLYVLDRNWDIETLDTNLSAIEVIADVVTLDLQGFTIETDNDGGQTIRVRGSCAGICVHVRNGSVFGSGDGAASIVGGDGITIENIRAGKVFLGDRGTIRDSSLQVPGLGAFARLERNQISCRRESCVGTGDDSTIIDNVINEGNVVDLDEVVIVSNNTFVGRNTILGFGDFTTGIQVNGNGNTIMHNLLNPPDSGSERTLVVGISVQGELNVLDGNILNGSPDAPQTAVA